MHDDSLFFLSVGKESTFCKPCLQLTLCQRGPVDFCNCTENVQIQASADSVWIAEVSLQLESYYLFTLWCRLAEDWKHTASRASLCRWWPAAVSLCAQCTQQMCWESEDGTKKNNTENEFIYRGLLMNLLERSRPLPAAESACPRCTPLWQTTGWWRLAPRCPSRCGTGRHRAGVPPRSASPSRWCGAPGSAGNPSSTQLGCKQAKQTNERDTQTPHVRQNE